MLGTKSELYTELKRVRDEWQKAGSRSLTESPWSFLCSSRSR